MERDLQHNSGDVGGVELSGKDSHLRLLGSGKISDIHAAADNSLANGVLDIGRLHQYNTASVTVLGSIGEDFAIAELIVGPGSTLYVEGRHIHVQKLIIKQGARLIAPHADILIGVDREQYGEHECKLEVLGEICVNSITVNQGQHHVYGEDASLSITQGCASLDVGVVIHHGCDDDVSLDAVVLEQ